MVLADSDRQRRRHFEQARIAISEDMARAGERGIQKTLVAHPFQAVMFGELFACSARTTDFSGQTGSRFIWPVRAAHCAASWRSYVRPPSARRIRGRRASAETRRAPS